MHQFLSVKFRLFLFDGGVHSVSSESVAADEAEAVSLKDTFFGPTPLP